MQTTVARKFLPNEFTISELQRVLLSVQSHPKISADSLFFTKAPKLPFLEKVLDENGQPKRRVEIHIDPSNCINLHGEVENRLYIRLVIYIG